MMKIVAITMLLILGGCSLIQHPRYVNSADNADALKKYEGVELLASGFLQSAEFNPQCRRLVGSIEPADGLTYAEFIEKAFNDEFKVAGIYSENGLKISADLVRVGFSAGSILAGDVGAIIGGILGDSAAGGLDSGSSARVVASVDSSTSMKGYWDIDISLSSAKGDSFEVSSRYVFASAFDGTVACNATAAALSPAVQDLIYKAITNPKFADLLNE